MDAPLHHAVQVLRRGGLVLHATEGVWGLAADPDSPLALESLLRLKRRHAAKGLILIGSDAIQFDALLTALTPADRRRVEASWPGAETWILPLTAEARGWSAAAGGRDTVAVRVPGHGQARELCRRFGGPVISTSANLSGQPPARNRFTARRRHTAWVRQGASPVGLFFLPGETAGRRGPSRIRTLTGEELRGAR